MQRESVSYWQATSDDVLLSQELPHTVDVAVIGGGICGAATCYWLARAGVSVALLERQAIGAGATGRNGGFVSAGPAGGYRDARMRLGEEIARSVMVLTTESKALLKQIVQEEEIVCEYREPGTVRLAVGEEQMKICQQEVALQHADGFPSIGLSRAQVQDLIKTELAPDILGGRLSPEQGLIHSARFVRGLAQAARRRGGSLYQAEVTHMVSTPNHVILQTARGTTQAGAVVLAVNAWTGQLLPALADIIVPVREQMLAYSPLPTVFTTGVTVDLVAGEYMQQTPDGTLVIGGCNTVAPHEDIGIWESTPTSIVQESIEQVVPRLFPKLAPLRVIQRWAGLLDCTTDRHPVVDVAPGMSRVWFTAGFSGHGMPFGVKFGSLLATLVTSGSLPVALQPFRLDRPTLNKWSERK